MLSFLNLGVYKLLHLCDVLYLNQSVFVGAIKTIYSDMGWLSFWFVFGAKFTSFWTSAENGFIYFVTLSYHMPALQRLEL